MKVTTLCILFICIIQVSFGQDLKNEFVSIKDIDNQIEEQHYNTDDTSRVIDRLVVKTPIKESDERYYSKKEWKKIKKQLQSSTTKGLEKNGTSLTKKGDTIYITLPKHLIKSGLSGG